MDKYSSRCVTDRTKMKINGAGVKIPAHGAAIGCHMRFSSIIKADMTVSITQHKGVIHLPAGYGLEKNQDDKQQITTAMDEWKNDALFLADMHIPTA